jgi:hypothetical protein
MRIFYLYDCIAIAHNTSSDFLPRYARLIIKAGFRRQRMQKDDSILGEFFVQAREQNREKEKEEGGEKFERSKRVAR